MNTPLYRACVMFSSLVWLNLLWLVSSLPIVTLPAATVALHEGARRLVTAGEAPTWRVFLLSLRNHFVPATAIGAIFITIWVGFITLMRTVGPSSPVAMGAILATAIVLAPVTAVAPHVMAASEPNGGISSLVRRLVVVTAVSPVAAVLAAAVWAMWVIMVFAMPARVALPLSAVVVSAPSAITAALAVRRRAVRMLMHSGNTPNITHVSNSHKQSEFRREN